MKRATFVMGLLCAACNTNAPRYYSAQDPLEVGGMGPDGMPQPGSASGSISIRYRVPTAAEQAELDTASAAAGFTIPWLKRQDIDIEILYTVTNLDDKPGEATVDVTGAASELSSYDLGALMAAAQTMMMGQQNQDEAVYRELFQGAKLTVPPGGSVQGRVREDDIAEIELDLDAIGRWMAVPESVLINRSEVNPVGLEAMPATIVVPALWQISVTFTASTHMKCEFLLRVRDAGDHLLAGGDTLFEPVPMAYAPPPPAPMM